MNLRQKRGQETKRRITEAAITLFHERGFNNVTVDEIVAVTKTSKGAFYNHFKSKHEVFAEQFKQIDQFYVEHLVPKLEPEQSIMERLSLFLELQMTYIQDELGWDVTRTIYEQELSTERSSYFLDPDRPLYDILIGLCQEGIEKGEFKAGYSAHDIVTVLIHGMRGVLYNWSLNRGKISLVDEQRMVFRALLDGLRDE
ncbi:TetR/AcrR family transcriptional regulator [Bhargavaea ginsengi]|uniref:TetR/AcrR family transcriptional regulator n=1 Tax=Bhargavaea ginsengi TaxID=426757 RepID=UPI00203AC169|nr:TetR/AcrR family transcriptional regulator [Bhargavaea ginsengi]MCM3087517.1 TetR/AcrR family transcriptional regulator [Bhargavaea ginsengi]